MATINLFGGGGHAKVIMDIIRACGHRVGNIYVKSPGSSAIKDVPVIVEPVTDVCEPLIIAVGSNDVRRNISCRFPDLQYAKLIHPSAVVSETAETGEGTVVMQGAIIQAEATIGRHCIINTGASVDHECRIADFVHIAPHSTLCGNVSIGEGTLIGAGTTIIPGIKIGQGCIIGAGSTVVTDIPDGVVASGSPCKIKRQI